MWKERVGDTMSMGPSYQFPVVVTRIVDGDTVDARIDMGFKIVYEERIRLLGLDTPEPRLESRNSYIRLMSCPKNGVKRT